jgi:hypothetical protein
MVRVVPEIYIKRLQKNLRHARFFGWELETALGLLVHPDTAFWSGEREWGILWRLAMRVMNMWIMVGLAARGEVTEVAAEKSTKTLNTKTLRKL